MFIPLDILYTEALEIAKPFDFGCSYKIEVLADVSRNKTDRVESTYQIDLTLESGEILISGNGNTPIKALLNFHEAFYAPKVLMRFNLPPKPIKS